MSNIFDLFRKIESPADSRPISRLVVGLGNPGATYDGTRHNAGFIAVDAIAKALSASPFRLKFRALVSECVIGDERVLLMKPETFMNLSGEAVGEAAKFYKLAPEQVVVLCDDISFAPGALRIRRKGSAGGHNGLKSIIAHLGSDAFVRFRLGVGEKPNPAYDLADWVLGKFPKEDLAALTATANALPEALALWFSGKEDLCMSRFSK
ncbi:MAG: aminoacyl-tRNA hydrolase [Clostridia bacterium]|nr:aminoacyl-tRNA hydrolase [Clostridia bacterium]